MPAVRNQSRLFVKLAALAGAVFWLAGCESRASFPPEQSTEPDNPTFIAPESSGAAEPGVEQSQP